MPNAIKSFIAKRLAVEIEPESTTGRIRASGHVPDLSSTDFSSEPLPLSATALTDAIGMLQAMIESSSVPVVVELTQDGGPDTAYHITGVHR